MHKVIKNSWGLELVTSHSSGFEQVQKNSFISYIFSDQVWWCNKKQFLSCSKNYICKFMQGNSWHYKLFHFYLSFCTWKVCKGREKITKISISQQWKSFLDKIKNTFHSFWRTTVWLKKIFFIKNSRHKQALKMSWKSGRVINKNQKKLQLQRTVQSAI